MEYKNFSKGTLTSQLSDVGTSLTITTTETFPTTGQFKAVIWGAEHSAPQEDSTREIMTLEWNSGTSEYDIIARGEESTSAKTWASGSFIGHIVTAEQYAGYENTLSLSGGTMTGNIIMPDAGTIGLGAGKALIQFDDEATDTISLMNCNIGIRTTAPDTLLTIANNNYISGKNYAGTDSINIIKVNEDDEIEVGATMNISGNIQGAEDGGAITLFDMPVTSTPAAGTEMSATLKVDGQNILKIYAEADGSGGVQNLKVKPLTTLETVAGTTSMAPIKMQSGTLLTTPEAGTIEYDGTDFYLSI
jgi:hypothetical protein